MGGVESDSIHPRLLPPDKFKRFRQFLTPPIQTVEFVEALNSKLQRVFNTENQFRQFVFKDEALEDDWKEYYDWDFWKTEGFKAMTTSINAVWVADLPEEQKGKYPTPYGYLVPITHVLELQNDIRNNCQYVIFETGDHVMAYDDECITKYEYNLGGTKKGSSYSGGELGREVARVYHELGYTPARQFWSDKMNDSINKKNEITKALTDLDYYLFMLTNQKYMELLNSYPITVAYENDEGVGVFKDKEDNVPTQAKSNAGSELMGAGSFLRVPPPLANEPDMMQHPVQIINPDVKTLDYHRRASEDRRNRITLSVIGDNENLKNDQAKNEKQVTGSFESQIDVLMRVKKNFEIIETFASETLARLRYGDQFINCTIDYGDRFFLKSLSQLHHDYNNALEAGGNEVLLESLTESIMQERFKNNPKNKMRAKILNDLNPLPNMNFEEILKAKDNGLVSPIDAVIATNFLRFVKRFETEQARINEFGSQLDYKQRLNKILLAITEYAKEILTKGSSNEN